ncbi:hypothetical protein FS594_08585 [Rahnella aquatilis]|nr:hypothetical protein FS594_08585 [Rahnella aquatilis]
MLRSTKKYLRVAGSVLNIMPSTNYLKIVGRKSDAENIASDFIAVGNDIRVSIDGYGNESGRRDSKLSTARR